MLPQRMPSTRASSLVVPHRHSNNHSLMVLQRMLSTGNSLLEKPLRHSNNHNCFHSLMIPQRMPSARASSSLEEPLRH